MEPTEQSGEKRVPETNPKMEDKMELPCSARGDVAEKDRQHVNLTRVVF